MLKEIESYNGKWYIPDDEERVIYRDEVIEGNGLLSCEHLYDMHQRGIILAGRKVAVKHPIFDTVEGNGYLTVEELIEARENEVIEWLRTRV